MSHVFAAPAVVGPNLEAQLVELFTDDAEPASELIRASELDLGRR